MFFIRMLNVKAEKHFRNDLTLGPSLVVWWLRICNSGDVGSTPGWGTMFSTGNVSSRGSPLSRRQKEVLAWGYWAASLVRKCKDSSNGKLLLSVVSVKLFCLKVLPGVLKRDPA